MFREWFDWLIDLYYQRIKRHISVNALCIKMGWTASFLGKAKTHGRGVRFGDLLNGLEVAGDEYPEDFFHEVFEKIPRDVVRILASNRERQGLAPSRFLVKQAKSLLALASAKTKKGERWQGQLARIRRCERLRFSDHRLAKKKLEKLIALGVRLLERREEVPPQALADLACALSSLGAVYRQAGRRDDSLDAFLLAYPLAVGAANAKAEGIWHQKAAYLLVDLGRCDRAYEFVEGATAHFVLARAEAELGQTMVDGGYVLSHAGCSQAALKRLAGALGLIPATDREYHFAIHQLMAVELAKIGDFTAALAELEIAERQVADFELGLASLNWSRAELATKLGDDEQAITSYWSALQLYEQHGSEALVATLTFEFAGMLLEKNRRPELLELTTGSSSWLKEAKRNRKIQEAFEDFLALAAMKELDHEALASLREKLPVEKLTPAQKRQKFQPPGGNCGPYSRPPEVSTLLFGGKGAAAG